VACTVLYNTALPWCPDLCLLSSARYLMWVGLCAGPVVAEATFLNREEVPVEAIYRDPVHDLRVLDFNPSGLEFMSTPTSPWRRGRLGGAPHPRLLGTTAGRRCPSCRVSGSSRAQTHCTRV